MTINASKVGLLLGAFAAFSQPASADFFPRPRVPAAIQVEAGNRPYLKGHAVGTQNYVCLPSGTAFAWTLFGPQATLFDYEIDQIMTHFLSANPYEAGLPRATWLHSGDSSTAWAGMINQSSDPAYVAQGAIPWFLLKVFGAQDGPTGGHRLARTTFIQRINTAGGVVPATGCALASDVGRKTLVPYEADYIFYKDTNDDDNE